MKPNGEGPLGQYQGCIVDSMFYKCSKEIHDNNFCNFHFHLLTGLNIDKSTVQIYETRQTKVVTSLKPSSNFAPIPFPFAKNKDGAICLKPTAMDDISAYVNQRNIKGLQGSGTGADALFMLIYTASLGWNWQELQSIMFNHQQKKTLLPSVVRGVNDDPGYLQVIEDNGTIADYSLQQLPLIFQSLAVNGIPLLENNQLAIPNMMIANGKISPIASETMYLSFDDDINTAATTVILPGKRPTITPLQYTSQYVIC